jgi:VCBS repeat-containing protein
MANQTTVKVATQTGAAKDDLLTSALSGLTEDTLSANLNVLGNDPGSAKLYSLLQNPSALASSATLPVQSSVTLASGAMLSMNADGTIAYDASSLNASLQSLAEGDSFTDTFVYTIRMANGALSTAKVTVVIAGANDAPTLAGVSPVTLQDTSAYDLLAPVTGTLAGTDIDNGSVLSYSLADGSQSFTDQYGTLTVDAQTGAYSFSVDPLALNGLTAGESATASFTVVVKDEHNAASAPVTISFDLIGANDLASISGNGNGNVTEDGTLTTGGTLTVADADHDEAVFQAPASLAGTYGDFSFDKDTGEWSYTLRNGDANVQALNGGAVVSDELTVTSFDGTASTTLHVDVTGDNDQASINGNDNGTVTEDGTLTTGGTLTVTDVDTGEAGFQAPASLAGTYGDFSFDKDTGEWSYTLRNDDANVQALNSSETVTDTLVVTSLDGSASDTITVNIGGADESSGTVSIFHVNYGQSDINDHVIFNGFDSNDLLRYSSNYEYLGSGLIDSDSDGIMDSSTAFFSFTNNGGKVSNIEVILVGYTGLTDAQVTH